MLNTVGFVCSWLGYALVSMHQRQKYGIKFYQPHTWIGMFTMVIYTINWFMGAILYTNMKCVPGYIKVYYIPYIIYITYFSFYINFYKVTLISQFEKS